MGLCCNSKIAALNNPYRFHSGQGFLAVVIITHVGSYLEGNRFCYPVQSKVARNGVLFISRFFKRRTAENCIGILLYIKHIGSLQMCITVRYTGVNGCNKNNKVCRCIGKLITHGGEGCFFDLKAAGNIAHHKALYCKVEIRMCRIKNPFGLSRYSDGKKRNCYSRKYKLPTSLKLRWINDFFHKFLLVYFFESVNIDSAVDL